MRPALLAFASVMLLVACARGSATSHASSQSLTELYARLHPSVVFLAMRAPSDDPKMHGKLDDAYGTAIVVASGDWGTQILTAKHVIDDAHDLRARIGDRSNAVPVTVVAQDDRDDLALLEAAQIKNATAAELGDSRAVAPGDAIGLLGYPIPDAFEDEGLRATASVYAGHVASIRDPGTRDEAIELDLPIIPGESGAPIFTMDGKVIGIAESRFEEEHAIGFATPMDVIKPFLERHMRK